MNFIVEAVRRSGVEGLLLQLSLVDGWLQEVV